MKIAIASGKGGTGKTTVAVNIASALAASGEQVAYVDCDVEEPNGALFLKPAIDRVRTVGVLNPVVDAELCDGCGECGNICRFSAIVVVGGRTLTFPEMCHSCGGCALICPKKAIKEVPREIGVIESGHAGGIDFCGGRLNVGEVSAVPLLRDLKRSLPADGCVILDSPPGTSCPVVETLKGADYVTLVTEPTPFGVHDLKMAVETVRELGLPLGVVLNRAGCGDDRVVEFCRREGIEVIAEIPDDRRIAEVYSNGGLIINELPCYRELFEHIVDRIPQAAKVMI